MDAAQNFEIGNESGAWLRVSSLGATLVAGRFAGVAIMPEVDPMKRPLACGELLLPWPNRLRDGQWQLTGPDGEVGGAVALNEPERHNAIHGLVRDLFFEPVRHESHRVLLSTTLSASKGYPFSLSIEVDIEAHGLGFTYRTRLKNLSPAHAPYVWGAHPYFGIDAQSADQFELWAPAESVIAVNERLLPIAIHPVDAQTDLRAGRRLDELRLDHGFLHLAPGQVPLGPSYPEAPRVVARLSDRHGRGVEVSADAGADYLQVFTPRERGDVLGPGAWVALEPMTGPADALNSGEGVRWLEPEATVSIAWSVGAFGDWN